MKTDQCSQHVIEYFNITTAPVLYFDQIFNHFNIICREKVFSDPNYMGSLHRLDDITVIIVNTRINVLGRINFTKAHELGHFCLKHRGNAFQCTSFDMSNYGKNPQEIEANQFAREFLMPKHMMRTISLTAPFDFETINSISSNFMVSKLATVFRILDFHQGEYAFVASRYGKITHSKVSNTLAGKINLRGVGSATDKGSFANACLNSNLRMNGYSSIDPRAWVSKNSTGFKISLKEYSRADKSSGSVMTLLKVNFL